MKTLAARIGLGKRFVTMQISKGEFFSNINDEGLPVEPDYSLALACGTVFRTRSWQELLANLSSEDGQDLSPRLMHIARKHVGGGAPHEVVFAVAKFMHESLLEGAEALYGDDEDSGNEQTS